MFKKIFQSIKKAKKTQEQIVKFFQWVETIKPKSNFDKIDNPTPPDYQNLEFWAAHPNQIDKSTYTPEGISKSSAQAADVFFIHPTTFFGNFSWNAPLDHPTSKEFVDEMIIPSQASVFNGSCRVFAPRYRQATFYAFLEGKSNATKAFDLAFDDILCAFDHYINYFNKGRPFFIAGHSQGALHTVRLMEMRIEGKALFQQFIACYSIGFRFPKEKFGHDFHQIKPANLPNQTGCVVAWDTYVEGGTPSNRLEKRIHWYKGDNWKSVAYKQPLGVNPISWRIDEKKTNINDNLGAVHATYEHLKFDLNKMYGNEPTGVKCIGLSAPYKAEVAATIKQDGFLYISPPVHARFRVMLLPRGNYHMYDYALFYMDIRQNIQDRLAAFLENSP